MKCFKLFPLFVLILLSSENFSQKIQVIEINNLDLNSPYAEIGIKYLKNQRVLIASSKKNNSNNKRDKRNNRQMGLRLYTGSISTDGQIANLELFSNAENNPINETNITFTSDYKTVYFTRNNYIQDDYRKQFKKDTLDNHILKLFKASLNTDGTLTNIEPLPINNNSYSVTNPQLSPDNKKLFFISDMKGSIGGFDIYEIDIHEDGTYGTPKNLGSEVNSKGTEMFPFVTQENILYYASNGQGGFGELDVFSYSLNDADAKSINLGRPINSNKDDFSLIYNANNQMGYFASNRKGGNGDADLYSFLTKPTLDEKEEELIVEVINTVENNNSSILAAQSTFSDTGNEETLVLIDQKALPPVLTLQNKPNPKTTQEEIFQTIENSEINSNTIVYTTTLNSETYKELNFDISKENSLTFADTTTSQSSTEKVKANIINESIFLEENEIIKFKKESNISEIAQDTLIKTQLDSVLKLTTSVATASTVILQGKTDKCIQIVEGYVQNNSNTVLTDAKITLYENGKNIGTFDIGLDGKYSFELKCNFHYRVTARLNKFEETYFELRTNRISGSKTTTNIVLKKIPCDILIAGQFRDLITNKPIADAKLYLIHNGQQVSQTATKKDGSYSFTGMCDASYQINTDKFGYEEELFSISQSSVNNSTIKFNGTLSPLPCLQVLNGRVTDLNTGEPIVNATVHLYNKNGSLKESALSNTNGNFHFTVNCNETYDLRASYKLFETESAEFIASSKSREVHRLDMPLKSLSCIQTIEGIIINARTKVPMGNVEVNLLKDGLKVDTKTVSGTGFFSFDILCESNYSIIANVKDFHTNSIEFTSSNVRNEEVDITLRLETKLDYELIRGEMMILIDPIDFDLDKSDIGEDAAIELSKIINAMTKSSNITVDIGVHTDSRAPDNYNLTLSEQRAQSIMSYIISRGIDASRLTGKGYGETQLLNKCANGVKCTEAEHFENRRIEFKVNQ